MEEAYITHDHGKRSTSPSNSEDFVLQMDTHSPETVNQPNHRSQALVSPCSESTTSDPDVLYPHDNPHPLDNEAIQGDVLRSFLYHQKEDEPEYELQRQYTARLDDLLDGNEKRQSPNVDGPHHRYSAYGEQFYVSFDHFYLIRYWLTLGYAGTFQGDAHYRSFCVLLGRFGIHQEFIIEKSFIESWSK